MIRRRSLDAWWFACAISRTTTLILGYALPGNEILSCGAKTSADMAGVAGTVLRKLSHLGMAL